MVNMKLEHEEKQIYKKGKSYNLADGDINLPKHQYTEYFENTDDDEIEGEWKAMDICKKSFCVITKTYSI